MSLGNMLMYMWGNVAGLWGTHRLGAVGFHVTTEPQTWLSISESMLQYKRRSLLSATRSHYVCREVLDCGCTAHVWWQVL
jgi:hypothetical protein